MPCGKGIDTQEEFQVPSQNEEASDENGATAKLDEKVEVFEGVDFTKFVDVSLSTLEEAKN